MGECWNAGTATFMILGNECTRACRFCDVKTSRTPKAVDLDEPKRLAEAAELMGLDHIVITAVARDDVADGGAMQFVRCIEELRKLSKPVTIEVLTSDFQGDREAVKTVLDAGPDIFNHNLETVNRLTKKIRSGAQYGRSLNVLALAKVYAPHIKSKSGIMLGMGELDDEIEVAIRDLYAANVDILTLGQYLRPSMKHHPVHRYVSPEEFARFKAFADDMGFGYVESGPLVRSSYHAEKAL